MTPGGFQEKPWPHWKEVAASCDSEGVSASGSPLFPGLLIGFTSTPPGRVISEARDGQRIPDACVFSLALALFFTCPPTTVLGAFLCLHPSVFQEAEFSD